ncbi:FAD/NAD(P)-binding oxidoreductase, partial [Carnobacterium sp.]
MKKIVIIGSNHAGLAAINVIVNSGIEVELVVFDKNSNLSYLGCGTSLFVGKQVE